MKRLFHGLVASAVGLMMAVPLGAFAYTHDEGGFRWSYGVWYDEDNDAWEASIYDVWQIDEKGNWKEWDATALVVPATLPAVGTNEFARAEPVYSESGNLLSNKYVTVYGPDVKSVVATVVYVNAGQEDNEKLTSLTVPETIEEVYGFGRCTNLSTVVMGAGTEFTHESFAATPWLKAQGEFVVRGDVLVAYQGAATSVTVPDGIVEIGDCAFDAWCNNDMTNLTSVTLPVGLEEIDDEAFDECEKLASINLPDSLVLIGDDAFSGCESLTSVTLPAKLKHIGAGAFSHCNGLTSIAIPEKVKELEYGAFYCCTGLTSVAFSDGLKFIGSEAFFGANLATVDIPASVKSIGYEAFAYCENLTTVTGCAGLEEVGSDAFYDTAFYNGIENDIVKVGPVVIGYKGTLPEELTIPEGVTKIGDDAFKNNASVKTLNLPSTLKEIGRRAFKGSAVETVNGGSGVTKVANDPWGSAGAFDSTPYENTFTADRGNNGKQFALVCIGGVALGYVGVCPAEIVIPDSVTCLSVSLFDCDLDSSTTNIESIVVGSGVKAIQDYAFYDAMNLKTVTVFGAMDEWGSEVFCGCTSLTDVTLTGSNLQLEEKETFIRCTNLVNVTINLVEPEESDDDDAEASLSLDSWTFSDCDKLASVKVTRPGFQLIGWNTWGALGEEVTLADEIDTFRLWRVMRDGKGEIYDHYGLSFQPKWKRVLRSAENDLPFTATVASTYIGWLTDADGNLVGSVSIKVQKGKAGAASSKATAQVTMIGAKKISLKGEIDANGNGQGALAGLVFTANGLAGTLSANGGVWTVDGARDVAKTSKDPEQSVFNALNKKVWTLVLAPIGDNPPAFANGFAGLSVSMGTKGKAKLSGVLPDGTKLSLSAQTIVGEYNCCIPFVYSKTKGSIGFIVWVDRAGAAVDVTSISEWKGSPTGSAPFAVKMGLEDFDTLEAIPASATFCMDPEDLPATLQGVQAAFLPTAELVSVEPRKWTLAKAATVKYKQGVFDQAAYDKGVAQRKTNNAGLKLRYTAKSGLYSGSFTIFTLQGTSLKKVTATVNGVVCGGVGYGSALVKKQGAMPVWIGEIEEDD